MLFSSWLSRLLYKNLHQTTTYLKYFENEQNKKCTVTHSYHSTTQKHLVDLLPILQQKHQVLKVNTLVNKPSVITDKNSKISFFFKKMTKKTSNTHMKSRICSFSRGHSKLLSKGWYRPLFNSRLMIKMIFQKVH